MKWPVRARVLIAAAVLLMTGCGATGTPTASPASAPTTGPATTTGAPATRDTNPRDTNPGGTNTGPTAIGPTAIGPTPTGPTTIRAAAAAAAAATAAPPRASSMRLPPTGGAVDYQLGGGYPVPAGVTIVTRDSTDVPAAGIYSICYVNGFQTQPEDRATWLADHPDLVLRRDGIPVTDENWPDEMILDTSTAAHRRAILAVVGRTMDHCRAAGFQAVEIDNLDSDTRSGDALSAADNRAMATLYVDRAHRLGMAIAQKNTAEQAENLRRTAGFDFVVAEECHWFDECAGYRSAYGDHVIDIEYTDDLRGTFADACADEDTPRSMVLRDRQLVPAGKPGHFYRRC